MELLASRGPLSAREIYEQFPISAPAISQHLKTLRMAELVLVEKRAQQRIYYLNPHAITEVETWAAQMTRQWQRRFESLDQVLAVEKSNSLFIERGSTMEKQTTQELTLTRLFDAPRELVFKAWTDSKLVAQWWGPDGFTNPVCELDARPGGAIRITMRGPDGVDYPMAGVFHEIVPPKRLVFTSHAFEDAQGHAQLEVLNTVIFEEQEGKTQLTLHAVVVKATPAVAGPLSGMEAGWRQSLEKLAGRLG
jgi:uncharacterized protein YndB with AHSA1/START domain